MTYLRLPDGVRHPVSSGSWRGEVVYLFTFGSYGSCSLFVVGDGDLSAALESAAEWLKENAPGHLTPCDEVENLYREACEELDFDPDTECDDERSKAYELATADLTYTEAGYLTAYEWFAVEVDLPPLVTRIIHAAIWADTEDELLDDIEPDDINWRSVCSVSLDVDGADIIGILGHTVWPTYASAC